MKTIFVVLAVMFFANSFVDAAEKNVKKTKVSRVSASADVDVPEDEAKKFAYEVCDSGYGGYEAKRNLVRQADQMRDLEQIVDLFRSHHEKVQCTDQQTKVKFNKPTLNYPEPVCVYVAPPEIDLLPFANYKVRKIENPKIDNHFAKTSKVEALYEVIDQANGVNYLSVQTPVVEPLNKNKPSQPTKHYSLGQMVEMKKLPDGSFENYLRSAGQSMGGSHLCNFPYFPGGS